MESLEILPVDSGRRERQFLDLPRRLYRDDPNWVEPLRFQQAELAGFRPHPFYQKAESQAFLAVAGGEAVGRILAIDNHNYREWHRDATGFFGFFESIDDGDVAQRLFDRASEWLAERGATAMRGPTNPSINYEWGLLVEGFDVPPMFMTTYNKPYYQALFEQAGFTKAHDLYAYWGHTRMMGTLSPKHRQIDEAIRERFGVALRKLDRRRFRAEVETFLDIYNRALSGTWGFEPLSEAEIHRLAGELRHLIVPELTLIAEVGGEPIGVVFGLLDYNQIIRHLGGRLFPVGWLRLFTGKRRLKNVRVISANVIPEYQNWGVGITLARGLIEPFIEYGIEDVEFSWVLESNDLSRKTLEKGGATRSKTYRIYDRAITS